MYTAFVPMIIYAVLGTSRILSVSATTTIAVLTATELGQVVPDGNPAVLLKASAMLTLMVGAALLLAGLLRLGFVANFISEPVLVGFKAGIGIVIVLDQLPKVLGIHVSRGSFLHNLFATVRGIPEASVITVAVGIAMVALLMGHRTILSASAGASDRSCCRYSWGTLAGSPNIRVQLIGRIPQGLPSITLPEFSLAQQLWPAALGIGLMSFTETVAAGRAFATSEEPPPRANRELLATGLANVGGAFLGAISAGGGITQTAVNRRAGARTQFAECITAAATLATILLLASVLALMTQVTLAAVVIV